MKKSKLFRILSVSLGLLFVSAGTAACSKECDHVIKYKVKTPATCMSEGVEEGLCNLCGYVETRAIPVDDNAHGYGDWQVKAPTSGTEGTATKICSYNTAHVLTQALPVLTVTGEGYTSVKKIKDPTAFEKGEMEYTLAHEAGDIVFRVATEETGVVSVADAVEAALMHKSQVRRGTGQVSSALGRFPLHNFSYEFGDNYAHINDLEHDYRERWYSIEDGEFYGAMLECGNSPKDNHGNLILGEDGKPIDAVLKTDTAGTQPYLDGYRFQIAYGGGDFKWYYGAEDLVKGLYDFEKRNANRDFKEEIAKEGGETVYKYSYSYYNRGQYFLVLDMRFTLSDTYALKTVEFHCKQYTRNGGSFTIPENEDEISELIDPNGENFEAYISYDQTLISELSEEEAANVPVNPYGKDSRKIKSFVIRYGLDEADENTAVSIPANERVDLTIAKIEPAGMADLTLDPIKKIYLVLNGRDFELNSGTMNSRGLIAYWGGLNDKTRITVKSQLAGELTLAVVTEGGYRKVFKLDVEPAAPTSLTASAYIKNATGGEWVDGARNATVYTGQSLLLRVLPTPAESRYVDTTVTLSAAQGASFSTVEFEGNNVYRFVATQAGTYTVTMTSVKNSSVKAIITVNVSAAPTPAEIFTGKYEANVRDAVAVGTITLEITPESSDGTTGTMKLTFVDNSTQVLSYVYTPNAEKPTFVGTLETQYKSGAKNNSFVSINEAYGLDFTYETKFKDPDNEGKFIMKTVTFVRAK